VGVPVLIVRDKKNGLFLTAVIAFIYAVFTAVPNKDPRYILPSLPFISMVIGYLLVWLFGLPRLWGVAASGVMGLVFAGYFFCLSFGFPLDPARVNYQRAVKVPLIGWVDWINLGKNTSRYLVPKYRHEAWPVLPIVSDLSSGDSERYPMVLVLVDKAELNCKNLELGQALAIRAKKNAFVSFTAPYNLGEFQDFKTMERYVGQFNYALIPVKSFGPKGALRHLPVLKQLKAYITQSRQKKVEVIKRYELPDGDIVVVYALEQSSL
jgi:hypothetical protein